MHIKYKKKLEINPLSANPTNWLNTLKQFVCHFVKLALKGLSLQNYYEVQ